VIRCPGSLTRFRAIGPGGLDRTPAIESYATSTRDQHDAEPDEIAETQILEPESESANDTPPRVAEMIKNGTFDRKPGQ
jgi:hypothetical protein